MPEADIRKAVDDVLDSVGLSHLYDRFPSELSGGMVKRAGFARAVITNPEASSTTSPPPASTRSSPTS